MNKTYRLIWNSVKDCWTVAAEIVRNRGGIPSFIVGSAALMSLVMAGALPGWALDPGALPTGGQIVAGSGSISQSGSNMTVNQNSGRMVANWNTFNIGQNAAVRFQQPNASSVALNRISDQNPSQIMGSLSANGQIFLINPSGIIFGSTARVDVGGIVASSLNLSNDNFMAGKYMFEKAGAAGAILNQGVIRTADGGYVAFLGPQVKNEGTITANKGSVVMAAADKVTLDFTGDGLLSYSVEQGAIDALAQNSGLIKADGGMVVMTAKAADSLTQAVVNNSGIIEAQTLQSINGRILLEGDQIIQSGTLTASGGVQGGDVHLTASGMVMNTGTIQATGDTGGQIAITARALVEQGTVDAGGVTQGGSVLLSARDSLEQTGNSAIRADATQGTAGTVRTESLGGAYLSGTLSASGIKGGEVAVTAPNLVLAGAALHADGTDGGGRVRVGGGWQGKDADLANAATTTVNHSDLTANATGNGDGGTVVVWSEKNTLMAGAIEARGGSTGGNGGKVEISSHGTLGLGGTVDVKAPAGTNGSLLLDPKNINIVDNIPGISTISLTYTTPQADDQHGSPGIFELMSGSSGTDRVVVDSRFDSTAAEGAGAVRLYKMSDGQLLATLTGSNALDYVGSYGVTALSNGNYVVSSPYWKNGAFDTAGAVTWGNGTTGISGVVSVANSLVGSKANDYVGMGGVTALTNGNYVVRSQNWDGTADGGSNVVDVGAVTWGNGSGGTIGAVSAANSLVGSTASDYVGNGGVTALTNGNYVVSSYGWNNGGALDAGAVTWGNGTTGISGAVTSGNSLVGSTASDYVGTGGVTALTNGNYVVISFGWNNGAAASAGAVTWGNGTTGISGAVTSGNSLVGSSANDEVGRNVTVLTNGNYVVSSPLWDRPVVGGGNVVNAGAVTWGSGTSGVKDVVSVDNSLVGSTASDFVGNGGVTALTNGNYVVSSYGWYNGAAASAGAVTWGNGTTGISGLVSSGNSLVGSSANDQVGRNVTALTNGNYVVSSAYWDKDATYFNVGAVTWGNGIGGTIGAVSSGNSLVGSTANDQVGGVGGVTALTNGNYVVSSKFWDGTFAEVGAVTWGNGEGGTIGAVSSANSLVGSQVGDQAGGGGVTALTNGNYVVSSPLWDRPVVGGGNVVNAGAVTWGSGTSGVKDVVSASNSLVGNKTNDYVGVSGVTALNNGNYVVKSSLWNKDASVTSVGAVTWGNGTTGISGVVSPDNSLVGSKASDQVGVDGVTALNNGNYVVRSQNWDGPAVGGGNVVNVGAVTWGSGTSGVKGEVSGSNSLVGSVASDGMGSTAPVALSNGNALVRCPICDFSGLVDSGRVDILIGGGSATTLTNPHTFATDPAGTSTLLASDIKALLDAGTSVTLQANNDITLSTALTANNASGNGGTLTMQAGRSVLLNSNITTDNGNLNVIGNETLAAGVVDAQRDAGAAVITMGAGTSIDAGTGTVLIHLKGGAGKTNSTSGAISLQNNIIAGTLTVINDSDLPPAPTPTPTPAPTQNPDISNVIASITSIQHHNNGTHDHNDHGGGSTGTGIHTGPGTGSSDFDGNELGGLVQDRTGYLTDEERRKRFF